MSEDVTPSDYEVALNASKSPKSRLGWTILRLVLVLESLAGLVVLWQTFSGVLGDTGAPAGLRASIIISVVLSWIWVSVTAYGAVKGTPSWARGSAITIHILMFSAAVGILQGILGTVAVGIALLLVAIIAIIGTVIARPTPPEPLDE